jgi:cis-3-alkyl-4-acyloxetan-2-one decarboxylase
MQIPDSDYKQLYDFSPNYASVAGHNMHYLDEGSGAPLVMIHGNPTWSFMYRDLIRTMRPAYRVIVPDHIGCGLSDKPSDDKYKYTLEQRINDLESLLETLEIRENITLVAHDWGGLIGAGYAVRHPDRVAKLVILNSAAFNVPNGKQLHWTLRFCSQSPLATALIEKMNAFSVASTLFGVRKHRMPNLVKKAYKAPYHNVTSRRAVMRFIQDIPFEEEHLSNRTIQEISDSLYLLNKKPMLICWGEKDFIFDLDFLREWQRRFPRAEVKRYPRAGHYVLEDETEAVCGNIKEFLRIS